MTFKIKGFAVFYLQAFEEEMQAALGRQAERGTLEKKGSQPAWGKLTGEQTLDEQEMLAGQETKQKNQS